MKQKYVINIDPEQQKLLIQEYAELDKDMLSLLCEVAFEEKTIKNAIAKGKSKLIAALRSDNMYPPSGYIDKIADIVENLYAQQDTEPHEVIFNDADFIDLENPEEDSMEDISEEGEEIDELLEDDFEDEFDENKSLNKMSSPLKIDEDSSVEGNEEG